MCLSKTILPVEVRTEISRISLITEQEEEIREKFSHVLDVVSGLGEFLAFVVKRGSVESDSHEALYDVRTLWGPETISHYELWRRYCELCDETMVCNMCFWDSCHDDSW